MKDTTQARVTVQWPEKGETSFWVGSDPDDENAVGPWTLISADAEVDVVGLLAAWLESQGGGPFEVEVRLKSFVLDQRAVYSYHDGVWANSDGSVCEDGPDLLPTKRR